MKARYKNKRDFYKAEAERQAELVRMWKETAEKKQREFNSYKNEEKKSLSCIVYCSNCQIVYSALVPRGATIHGSGCAYCGVKDSGYLVREMKV